MNNTLYYWGYPDTTVSFCEKKYDRIYWIAEYNNTVSAGFYLIFGLFFLFTKIKHVGTSMIILGISTAVMHGTLRFYGQWLDECSMLIVTYSGIQLIDKSFSNYGYIVLTLLYFAIKEYFILFFLLFTSMQLYIFYLSCHKNVSYYQKIFILEYMICFIIGFICWIIDQTLCNEIGDFPFHALWHLFSSYGMFSGFLSFII